MIFNITHQYARGEEKLLAQFNEEAPAAFFIEKQLAADETQGLNAIYRLYKQENLLKEYNKEKITGPISNAQYANGYQYFPLGLHQPITVSYKSSAPFAAFSDLTQAQLFVAAALKVDALNNQPLTYCIYNHKILVEEHAALTHIESESTEGKGQTASFRPTPLNTSPRPPGTPANWVKGEDEKE